MPDVPAQLTAMRVSVDSAKFQAIVGWPFADGYVARLLQIDIPQRVQFGYCAIWTYRDPDGRLAGFGTLDVCGDCRDFTGGRDHPYVPVLGVNPTMQGRGHGMSIVRHLVDESMLLALGGMCHDVLFLDVYTSNVRAIRLYARCGFMQITSQPLPDPQEGGATYIIMAKSVAVLTC